MKLARSRLPVARERTGGDSLLASPVPLGGQSTRQFAYNLISYFPNSANGRGVRCASGSGVSLSMKGAWKSSFNPPTFDLPNLAKADARKASLLPFFLKVNDNRTHSQPPGLVLEKPNMEQLVSEVCPKDSPKVTDSDIEQARQAHQRLIVRLMTAPGDSEGAYYRAEQMFGLPYWCQVNLRQKRRASAEFIARVHAAWLSMLEASVVRDTAELLEKQAKAEEAA